MRILMYVILGLVFSCAFLITTVPAQTVAEITAQSDSIADVAFQNKPALDILSTAADKYPGNYNIVWRLSRTYSDMGAAINAISDEQKTQQLELYEKSLDYANQAIAANPEGSMGYTRRAIANGRIALFKGVWESIDLVKQVKHDCEKAIELDTTNSLAYYIYGRTHAKVSEKPKLFRWPLGLGWGNIDEAIKNFEIAISLRPNYIMYRLDAAKAYIEEDEYEKARAHLNAISTIPKAYQLDDDSRKEATELLEKIKNK
ncbi:MAG: tetratricopeptide repeat protein [Bacteroidota bacterium]